MSELQQSDSPVVVSARGVVKRYGKTVALAGLDAEIGPGITGLLGSNGAGKTTFISVLLGLRSRDAGELTVLGHDPATAGLELRARIGYAPEHHDLPAELAATISCGISPRCICCLVAPLCSARTKRSGWSASARSASVPSGRCPRDSGNA